MNEQAAEQAGQSLLNAWRNGVRIDALPEAHRPMDRAEGYAVQAALARQHGQLRLGWKIAATSAAGQAHIGVDGPLAGPLLADRCLAMGAPVPLGDNLMRVAEAEFAFRLDRDLPRRESDYSVNEVMQAVDMAYPAIEVPDSRFSEFARVGTAQLVADLACASWFVLGEPCPPQWRDMDLARHPVTMHCNGEQIREGSGANVLGDPRVALTWLANELCEYAEPLQSGDIVTTGTCITPAEVAPGNVVRAEFGPLGRLEVVLR